MDPVFRDIQEPEYQDHVTQNGNAQVIAAHYLELNVQVMKIVALPKIILSATILHVPQDVISELTKMFLKFPWGKVDRVKR